MTGQKRNGLNSRWITVPLSIILLIVAISATAVCVNWAARQVGSDFTIPDPLSGITTGTGTPSGYTADPGTGTQTVTKKASFYIKDALDYTVLNGSTVTLYDRSGNQLESLTASSAGIATSGTEYQSGTEFIVGVSMSGYVTQFFPYTIPRMTTADAQTATTHYTQTLGLTDLGTYSIKVTDSSGTSYTSGSTTYNWTAKGVSQDTFTIAIYETENNAGWASSYNPVDRQNQNLVAQMYFNGTGYQSLMSGYNSMYTSGTVKNWFRTIPDSTACRQVSSAGQVLKDGVTVFTITVNKGSFAADCESLTIDLRDYFDTARFASLGDGGQSDESLTSFTLLFTV